jgi:hypothetical protein
LYSRRENFEKNLLDNFGGTLANPDTNWAHLNFLQRSGTGVSPVCLSQSNVRLHRKLTGETPVPLHDPRTQIVKAVNGIQVKNLNHLIEILRDAKNEFITIECYTHYDETMVFPRAKMLAATDEILNDNGIRAQGSPDALAIW